MAYFAQLNQESDNKATVMWSDTDTTCSVAIKYKQIYTESEYKSYLKNSRIIEAPTTINVYILANSE